ncbi:hypothetical protein EDB80DRAFT_689914 [Ilyonectria destructans]|nr:hypothetical protein EDB80DRAFT_689914 [Ilyonectria destructans]
MPQKGLQGPFDFASSSFFFIQQYNPSPAIAALWPFVPPRASGPWPSPLFVSNGSNYTAASWSPALTAPALTAPASTAPASVAHGFAIPALMAPASVHQLLQASPILADSP